MLGKTKPVTWNEKLELDINQPTDFLTIVCVTHAQGGEVVLARGGIALNHLPVGASSEKWYQLKSDDGRRLVVVLLNIHCSLLYSMSRRATASVVSVPSQVERNRLLQESMVRGGSGGRFGPFSFCALFVV